MTGSQPGGQRGDQPQRARQAIERRSAVPLLYLRRLPAWLLPVALAGLLIAGLAMRGAPAAAALCCVAAVLGWLAYLSWPQLSGAGRLGRATAVCCLLAAAAVQAAR